MKPKDLVGKYDEIDMQTRYSKGLFPYWDLDCVAAYLKNGLGCLFMIKGTRNHFLVFSNRFGFYYNSGYNKNLSTKAGRVGFGTADYKKDTHDALRILKASGEILDRPYFDEVVQKLVAGEL